MGEGNSGIYTNPKGRVIRTYTDGTVIRVSEGRIQPYTVWKSGHVIQFCKSLELATTYCLRHFGADIDEII